jgi:hypothetical protein
MFCICGSLARCQRVTADKQCLQDGDTDVAETATQSLIHVSANPEHLHRLLSPQSHLSHLFELVQSVDATTRCRGLALLVRLAGTSHEAAQAVLDSGAAA